MKIQITDVMVEEATIALRNAPLRATLSHDAVYEALRCALSVAPDRYREGWIAGRDAAAGLVDRMRSEEFPDKDFRTIRARISAMDPPK